MRSPTPPRVLIRPAPGTVPPIPAPFGRSMFDRLASSSCPSSSSSSSPSASSISSSSHRHFDRMMVTLEERFDRIANESSVVLGRSLPADTDTTNANMSSISAESTATCTGSWSIPFARAIDNPNLLSERCPTVALSQCGWYDDHSQNTPRRPHVRLGIVAAVQNPLDGRILLTRRSSHMRSFPHAWVMPGGGMDAGESLVECCAREIHEETGVDIDRDTVRPFAAWESCYPTCGRDCVEAGTGITAHYLAVFCTAQTMGGGTDGPPRQRRVNLDEEETDAAVWLSSQDLARTIEHPLGGVDLGSIPCITTSSSGDDDSATTTMLALEELCGIYPRGDAIKGIAQGNLFMLEELLQTEWGQSTTELAAS